MILAFLFDDYDWPLTPVAAILDFAIKTVPGGVDLGAHKKSKKYGMDSIWAKFGPFGRIWTKQSIWYPYSPDYQGKLRLNLHSLSVSVNELLEYRRKFIPSNRICMSSY
jgi:hypothetical protein